MGFSNVNRGKVLCLFVFAFASIFFLFASGCAPNPKAIISQEKIKKGEEIFNKNCVSCHGEKGKGGLGPSLVSPQIKKAIEEKEESSEVELTILKGKNKMPSFEGKFSHQDLHNLLKYLLSLQEE